MKYAILTLCAFALAGCETITNEDGTTTTRFDGKAAASMLETGYNAYDRYNRQSYVVGYDVYGNPIYRQQ